LRETRLPARVADHHQDRHRVLEVGLHHRREALGVVDQAARLAQKDFENRGDPFRVLDHDQVPALGVGPGGRPATGFGDLQQQVTWDAAPLLEFAYAAAASHHLEHGVIVEVGGWYGLAHLFLHAVIEPAFIVSRQAYTIVKPIKPRPLTTKPSRT